MNATGRLISEFANAGTHRPFKLLGASGQLGYGIPSAALNAGLARKPDLIGCDMGSIDIGPYYLGSGNMATAQAATRRDLRKVLMAARSLNIPLVIGSAGSAGAAPHLEKTLELVRGIAREDGLHFRMGILPGDIDKDLLKTAVRNDEVIGIDQMPELRIEDIDAATHIVGQMGVTSFQQAFEADIDVLIAGRACDTAIFAALPIMLGFPAGLAIHMAKIVECASLCCVPGGRDTILATLDDEGFELESMAPQRSATPVSVAAHSLYEQSDPFTIIEPEGHVDLRDAHYEALDSRRTRVSGARWVPAAHSTVKIEGACAVGERAVLLCGAADPRFIAQSETILRDVAATVAELVCEDTPKDYSLFWRIYGVNGVSDPLPGAIAPNEVFLLIECIAPSSERATEVVRTMKQYLLHFGYAGRLSTGGNIAFAFTPPEITVGTAYRFNVYHIMRAPDPERLFPLRTEEL